jgi:RNA polymerase sigma factor (sigma-70 family)
MITNTEFETALANEDNIKIMKYVARKFREKIPYDELQTCQLHGLWKALRTFKPEGNVKFTSVLFNQVLWACDGYIKSLKRPEYTNNIPSATSKRDGSLFEYVEGLPEEDAKLLYQRFRDNMTLKEIAAENGYSHEHARKRIKEALQQVKNRCLS